MNLSSRNIAIGILGILTLLFAVASIYIGLQVTQDDTAPQDTSAQTFECGPILCADGSEAGQDCTSPQNCNARAEEFCSGVGSTVAQEETGAPSCEDPGDDTDPNLVCPGGAVGNGCLIFICNNGCGTDGRCEGDDVGVQIFTENGSCGATLDGRCGQIDVVLDPRVDSPDPGFQCVKGGNQNTCNLPACNWECGDGVVDFNEECDDGNNINDDECSNACTTNTPDPSCGDGNLDAGEECDDGNSDDSDGCRNDCTLPSCGDGVIDTGEECDDGNSVNDDECTNNCTIPTVEVECGDPCSSSDECPNDHTCNNGTCVLDLCIDNPECTNNGCTLPLPETSIFDGESNKLLIGILFLLLALLFTQLDVYNLQKMVISIGQKSNSNKSKKQEKDTVSRKRERYEKRINNKYK